MKVLHIVSSPAAGGAEIYVKDLARYFVTLGHSIHIGFLGHANQVGRSDEFEKVFLKELTDAGIKYFFIGHETRKMPWLGACRVRRYVRRNKIQLYHAHLIYGVVFGALLRIPRLYTHHSEHVRRCKILFFLTRPFVDHLVGISKLCSRALKKTCRREVTTILNGVDKRRFSGEARAQRRLDRVVDCISVGRICEHKNYDLLVQSILLLDDDLRERIVVKIAGEGSPGDTANLLEAIREANLSDSVTLLGTRTDIPKLLAHADLFLMSSVSEGLPIALIEAAMSGLPCVVTDVGGCKEIINSCENGVVVEPNNAPKFAAALQSIINDRTLLAQYSANALRLSSQFSIERSCTSHLILYEKMLQNRAKAFA